MPRPKGSTPQNAGDCCAAGFQLAYVRFGSIASEAIKWAPAYCDQRMLRRAEDGAVYLLRTTQMNGWHAELFTYCLYENMLKPARDDGRLTLLTRYEEKVTTEEEPGVRLSGRYHEHLVSFFLEWRSGQYRISLVTPDPMPAELAAALQDLEFIQTGTTLSKQCPMGEIENVVRGLDVLMAE